MDALIKSMEIVSQKVHHCHLIIGGTGPETERLRNLVKKIKLDRSYLGVFSEEQLANMREIVGDTAADWGYE